VFAEITGSKDTTLAKIIFLVQFSQLLSEYREMHGCLVLGSVEQEVCVIVSM